MMEEMLERTRVWASQDNNREVDTCPLIRSLALIELRLIKPIKQQLHRIEEEETYQITMMITGVMIAEDNGAACSTPLMKRD